MGLPTSRHLKASIIRIDYEECKACGLCEKICKGVPLYLENGKIKVDQTHYLCCIDYGYCVAV